MSQDAHSAAARFDDIFGSERGSDRGDDPAPKPRTAEDRRALIEMSLDLDVVEEVVRRGFERIAWAEGEERTAPSGLPAAHYRAFCPFFIEVSVDPDCGVDMTEAQGELKALVVEYDPQRHAMPPAAELNINWRLDSPVALPLAGTYEEPYLAWPFKHPVQLEIETAAGDRVVGTGKYLVVPVMPASPGFTLGTRRC